MSAQTGHPLSDSEGPTEATFSCVWVKQEVKDEPEESVYDDDGTDAVCDSYNEGYEGNIGDWDNDDEDYSCPANLLQDDSSTMLKEMKPRYSMTKRNKQKHQCPYCDYEAPSSALKCHIRKHTNEKQFECKKCDFRSNYRNALLRHQGIHHGELKYLPKKKPVIKKHKCPYCDYYATNSALRQHVVKHTKEKPYTCNQCGYKTAYHSSLMRHISGQHGSKPKEKKHYEKKYSCNECSYITAHRHALRSHMAKHSNEKPHKCDLCKYRTNYQTALHRHRLMQHKDKLKEMDIKHAPREYVCVKCNYTTFFKHTLKVHTEKHNSDRTNICFQCRYETPDKETFMNHLGIHGVEPAECKNAIQNETIDANNDGKIENDNIEGDIVSSGDKIEIDAHTKKTKSKGKIKSESDIVSSDDKIKINIDTSDGNNEGKVKRSDTNNCNTNINDDKSEINVETGDNKCEEGYMSFEIEIEVLPS